MNTTPEFVLFLGRFHPLLVHLPIGMLLLAGVMELFGRKEKYQALKGATGFVLMISAISAIGAAFLGWMLSQGGGYDEDLLFWHKWQGIGLAVFATLAWLIKAQPKKLKLPAALSKAYTPLLILSIFMLGLAGHNGGSLTHGEDYLFQYAPQPIRTIAGLPPKAEKRPPITDIQEAEVFADLVQPMLEQRCVSCHRAGKKKGDLRMDTAEQLRKGGDEGPVFVAGNAEESNLFIRVNLPEEDEEHMPPEGKKPLSEKQIALLGWWIDAGAPMDSTTVAQLEIPEYIKPVLAAMGEGSLDDDPTAPQGIFAEAVGEADASALGELVAEGVLAMPISQQTNYLRVKVNQDTTPFGNAQMQLLVPLADQITWLDLRYATPSDFSVLAQLSNLTELHLEQSTIKDADLKHLEGLQRLEYLNLYGTEISNAGLESIKKLSSLKVIYLWQTQVDKAGVEALREALPELEINVGWDDEVAQASVAK
ncbi:MAG: c-type cytochrome domain-containing protein [Bacteroidota bacterium]